MDTTALVGLQNFWCYASSQTTAVIAATQPIIHIEAQTNNLTSAEVDAILVALDGNGLNNGVVDLSGQTPSAPPTGTGRTAAASLIGKGWTVTLDEIAWAPATETVTWIDTNGTFTNDLATFLANADFDTVSSMVFGATGLLTSLTGLQALPAMATLDCNTNALTSLDLSNCAALTTLNCSSNASLTTLTLTGCTALVTLNCADCDIQPTLDLSPAAASLTTVSCPNNPNLVTLSFNGCSALSSCDLSALTSLDSINFTGVTSITGNIDLSASAVLSTITAPNLSSVSGYVSITSANIVSISLPSLASIDAILFLNNASLQTVNLASLNTVSGAGLICTNNPSLTSLTIASGVSIAAGDFEITNCSSLAGLSLDSATMGGHIFGTGCSSLTSVSITNSAVGGGGHPTVFDGDLLLSSIDFSGTSFTADSISAIGCSSLATLTLTGVTFSAASTFDFSGCALTVGDATHGVDGVIARFNASSVDNCIIDVSGGTNAQPSSCPPVVALRAFGAGNTVTVNGPC